jgi:hypothetical protein
MYVKKGDVIRMVYGVNGAETIDYRALYDFNVAVLKDLAMRSEHRPLLDEKNKHDAEPFFGEYLREYVGCVELVKEPAYSVKLSGDTVEVRLRTAIKTL